jgi:hypothetical protein
MAPVRAARPGSAELLDLWDAATVEARRDMIGYFRRRGRRDLAPKMRAWAADPELREAAVDALGAWRDREARELVAASGDLDALARIDPDAVRPRLDEILASRDEWQRERLLGELARFGDPRDRPALLRAAMTSRWTSESILGLGRIGQDHELLLDLLEEGGDAAALALACAGERAAIPTLLRGGWWADLNALDFIVNRERYGDLRARRALAVGGASPERYRAELRRAFGIEAALEGLSTEWIGLREDADVIEAVQAACGPGADRCHVWRNGRVEWVKIQEARRHWAAALK